MSLFSWVVTAIALAFALVPGFLIGTRLERALLLAVPLVSLGWILASNAIFGTREQLYGGGTIVYMALLPPVLAIWVLASLGAGLLVNRGMRRLGGRGPSAVTLGWVAGITLALALPLLVAIGGLVGTGG